MPHRPRGRRLLAAAVLAGALAAFPASASSHDAGAPRDQRSWLTDGSSGGPGQNQGQGQNQDQGQNQGQGHNQGQSQGDTGSPRRDDARGRSIAVTASWSPGPAAAATSPSAPSAWNQGGDNGQSGQPATPAAPAASQWAAPAASTQATAPGPTTWASRARNDASHSASQQPTISPAAAAPTAQAASVTPAPASAPAATPAATPVSTPTANVSTPASAPAASAVHGLGAARHARRGGAGRARSTGSSRSGRTPSGAGRARNQPAPSGRTLSLGASRVIAAARAAAARPAGAGVQPRTTPRASSSPLVRTVTRIIHVIPAPLRPAVGIVGVLALALAAAAALLVLRSRRLDRQRQRLVADVGLLESTLLPRLPEQLGPACVSTAYRPAEDLAAGGDFFDAFALSDKRTCLIVGDIAGHNRESILLTSTVRYTLRAYLEAGLEPRVALAIASGVLGPRLSEQMATAVVAIFDGETGRLTYACAGHPSPILVGTDLRSPTIGSSPLLGAGVPTGRRQVTVSLPPGASACFYTDGLIDPRIAGGRFGAQRLSQELAELGPRCTAQDILLRVLARSDEQTDDMTACVLRPLPDCAVGPADHIEEIEFDAPTLGRSGARFMEACGVSGEAIPGVLELARNTIARSGTAVITIRIGEDNIGEARVDGPPSVVVPLTMRSLSAPPAAAMAASG